MENYLTKAKFEGQNGTPVPQPVPVPGPPISWPVPVPGSPDLRPSPVFPEFIGPEMDLPGCITTKPLSGAVGAVSLLGGAVVAESLLGGAVGTTGALGGAPS